MTSEELKKLLDAATPGPWTYTKCQCGSPYCHQYVMSNQGSVGLSEHDARLISIGPELAAEVIRLREALLDMRGLVATAYDDQADSIIRAALKEEE